MRKEKGRKIFEGTMGDKNKRETVLKHEWFPCNADMKKKHLTLILQGKIRKAARNAAGFERSALLEFG